MKWLMAALGGVAFVAGFALARTAKPDDVEHRPTAEACEARPAGTPDPQVGGCKSDAECKGKHVHCQALGGGHELRRNECVSDACMKDSECGKRSVCACNAGYAYSNQCLKGNCRVDKDCGKDGLCSPSAGEGPSGGCSHSGRALVGYFCRTRKDTCVTNEDCTGEHQECVFVRKLGHWGCVVNRMCPVG